MQEITVFGIDSYAGDGADLHFEYCHKRISVSVFPSTHSSRCAHFHHKIPVEDRLVHLLVWATTTPDDDEYDHIVENVLRIILNAGKVIFDDMRKNLSRTPATGLRSSILEVLRLRLLTLSGELSLVPIEPEAANTHFDLEVDEGFKSEDGSDDDFSRYPSPETRAEEFLTDKETAWSVHTEDESMLDHRYGTDYDESMRQELKRLLEIPDAGFQGHIRKPLSYIVRVPGIYPDDQWALGDIPENMDIPPPTAERSREWSSQVREADAGFHDTGITWGKAKNGNDLVDLDEDSRVICPGRGWEEDSVDEELAVPVAADELGSNRIVELSDDR